MLTLTNRIDMRPGAVPLVIHLGQYDSDFSLVFELYSSAGNFTVESGTTAMIRGTKTDGHAYDADATIDVSAKTVTVAGSEQMTAAKGRNVYELVLTKSGKVLSTANFILDVERAAMDADTIASESVLKELNAIIAGAETATEAAADAATAADRAEDAADSVSSASAQIATNTADIADLKADFEQLEPGLSDEAKTALLACFAHVAWIDEHGQDYYDALEDALSDSSKTLVSISAAFNAGGNTIYTDDALDDLKQYLTVTAHYNDSTSAVVTGYSLSGTLAAGVNTITVSYEDKVTTFSVSAVAWGFTWNASSNTIPTGMTYAEDYAPIFSSTDGMHILRPDLIFDNNGSDCEIEIEMKYDDVTSNTSANNPSVAIIKRASSANQDGIKMLGFYNGNPNIYSNVDGSFRDMGIIQNVFHTYKLRLQNSTYTMFVDGEEIASGGGVFNNAYLGHTGINTTGAPRAYMYIKKIKYRLIV